MVTEVHCVVKCLGSQKLYVDFDCRGQCPKPALFRSRLYREGAEQGVEWSKREMRGLLLLRGGRAGGLSRGSPETAALRWQP